MSKAELHPLKFQCWTLNLQHLTMWLNLKVGPLKLCLVSLEEGEIKIQKERPGMQTHRGKAAWGWSGHSHLQVETRGLRRNQPFQILDLGLLATRTVRRYIFVVQATQSVIFFLTILFIYLFIYLLERGREGKREGEKISVWLRLAWPLLGIWPETQACALRGNWTGGPMVCSPHSIPLSYTSQGPVCDILLWPP